MESKLPKYLWTYAVMSKEILRISPDTKLVMLHSVDYLETFSPTARMESIRILMQVSVQQNLLVHQKDVESAYLHDPCNQTTPRV